MLLVLGVIGIGCGGAHTATTNGSSHAPVAAVIKGLDNPFFATMRDGLVATAARYNTPLAVAAAADVNDAAGQAARVQPGVGQPTGCYIVAPTNQTNLIRPLARVAKDTPIVNLDLPIDRRQAAALGVRITTFIATDNLQAGRAAADAMARSVVRGARVAMIMGPSGDANSQARTDGFRIGAAGHFSVVTTAAADWDRLKSRRAMAELLAADRRLTGVFAANDLMALGAADAVAAAGRRGGVAIVGVDGIPGALTAVAHGDIAATVAQSPYTMGELGVEACLASVAGKHIPATIRAPLQVVTRANVVAITKSYPKPLGRFDDPIIGLLPR
jgi:ABC-type sugar transport system substrate-binding protein